MKSDAKVGGYEQKADTRPTCGQACQTRQSPNPNRSKVVNPHPADGKNSVLFQEVSAVRHYMAKGISNGAVGGAEKSAEAIVAPKRAKG